MQVLTPEKARVFLAQQNLAGDLSGFSEGACRAESTTDVGERCAYANVFTKCVINSERAIGCLDISGWSVWPSATNLDLFYSYRRYLGEHRTLIDAHFHVFRASEANELRNILHLSLISLFDVAGLGTETNFRFFASHDEYIQMAWQEGADWMPLLSQFLDT